MPRLHVIVRGQVQGVFFRVSASREAKQLNLTGWVRNRQDGGVEICAEGAAEQLAALKRWCAEGPPGAFVSELEEIREEATGEYRSFEISG
jgi:acylphosphatase